MNKTGVMNSRYAQVAERLRADILSGTLPAGDRLPAERDLETLFNASRVTIRRALRTLQEERLIVRRRGSGNYVSPRPERKIPLMIDFTGSVRDHAPALRRRLCLWRRQPAGSAAAAALDLEAGTEILYAERIDELDGQPVAWDQAAIAPDFARKLQEKHLTRVDFLEAWAGLENFQLESCRQIIEALNAESTVAARLGLEPGAAVLKSSETYLTANERPAGFFISYYSPRSICIASHYRWGSSGPVAGKVPL